MIKVIADPISPEELRKLLRYEPETGKLFWCEREGNASFNARWAGQEAFGCVGRKGYLVGRIYDRGYRAHRVIIAMVTGEWPEQVEHDNRDRADNRWVNIAPTNSKDQAKNKKMRSDNSSGHTGVFMDKRRGTWNVTINGKHFASGLPTFEGAVAIRCQAEQEYGYHPNHGRIVT